MKEVVKIMGEILAGIGLQVVIFTTLWFLTRMDILSILFLMSLIHITVFLPVLIKMEEK